MNRIHYNLFMCFFLLITFSLSGQTNIEHITKEHIENNITKHQLTADDVKEWRITSDHVSSTSGVHHIYGNQQLNGIDIFNATFSLHLSNSDSNVVAYNNQFCSNLRSKIKTETTSPSISAINAVRIALQELNLDSNTLISITKTKSNFEFIIEAKDVSKFPIRAKLIYYQNSKDEYNLTWNLIIDDHKGHHLWDVKVDAVSGEVKDKQDRVLSCAIDDHKHDAPINGPIALTSVNSNTLYPNVPTQSYNVFEYPIESPYHGEPSLVVNPYDAVASPDGWHEYNDTPYYTTKGNNVNAYADPYGNDIGYGSSPSNSNLIFDYEQNLIYIPDVINAPLTNLFYWANLFHDITYRNGFDEESGNFQEENHSFSEGHGDSIWAETQDENWVCDPRFFPNPDGTNSRMEISGCGTRDSALDNIVIIHEYAHGVSTRLVGGRTSVETLINPEQMGEGWSDWFGLMMTMTPNDLPDQPRTLGTWIFNQQPDGPGIREWPYSTNMSISPYTYDHVKSLYENNPIPLAPYHYHNTGSVWASMLWEVTWEFINKYGFDSNLHDGNGGNRKVLALIIESLKFTPTNPGFVDARDAIIQADNALFDGENNCIIWRAFAKRGLGVNAQQNNTSSFPLALTDNVSSFETPECFDECLDVKAEITNETEFLTCEEVDFDSNDAWFEVQVEIQAPIEYTMGQLTTDLNNNNITLDIIDIDDEIYTLNSSQINFESFEDGIILLSFPIQTEDFMHNCYEGQYDFRINANLTTNSGTICSSNDRVFGINLDTCASDLYNCSFNYNSVSMNDIPNCNVDSIPFNVTGDFFIQRGFQPEEIKLVVNDAFGAEVYSSTINTFSDDDFTDITTFPCGRQGTYDFLINESVFPNLSGNYEFQVLLYTRQRTQFCEQPKNSQIRTFTFNCDEVPWCENRLDITTEIPDCEDLDLNNFTLDICGIYCVAQSNNTFEGLQIEIIPAGQNNGQIISNFNPTGDSGGFCFNLDEFDFSNGLIGSYTFEITAFYENGIGTPYTVIKTAGEINFDDCQDLGSCDPSSTITPPYSEGFENGFGLWLNPTNDTIDWSVHNGNDGNGPPSGFGNNSDWYAYAQQVTSGNSTNAILLSPCVDLRNSASATIDFDMFFTENLNQGTLTLEISSDDGENWTTIHTIFSNLVGIDWGTINNIIVPDPFLGEIVRLRFVRTSTTGEINTAIDNININHEEVEEETCPDGNIEITSITGDCETLLNGGVVEVCGVICYEENYNLSNLNLQVFNSDDNLAATFPIYTANLNSDYTEFCYNVSLNDFSSTLNGSYYFKVTTVHLNASNNSYTESDIAYGLNCESEPECDSILTFTSNPAGCEFLLDGNQDKICGAICYEDGQELIDLDLNIFDEEGNLSSTIPFEDAFLANNNTTFCFNFDISNFNLPEGNYIFVVSAEFNDGTTATLETIGVSFDDCSSDPCDGINITITNEDDIPNCTDLGDPWVFDLDVLVSGLPNDYTQQEAVADILNNYTLDVIDLNNNDNILVTLNESDIVPNSGFFGNGSVGVSYRLSSNGNMSNITATTYAFRINATLNIDTIECPLTYTAYELSFEECEEPSCDDMAVSIPSGIPHCYRIIGNPNGHPICVDYVIPQGYQPVTLTLSFNQVNGSDDVILPVSGNNITVTGTDQQGNGIGSYCFTITENLFQTPVQGVYDVNTTLVIEDSNGDQCDIELPEQPVLDFTDCEPEFSCDEVSVTLASEIPKCDDILGSESFQLCLDYVLPFGYQDPVTLELIFTQQQGGGDQFSYTQEGLPISGTDTNGNSTGTFCFTVNTSDFENPFDGYYAIDAVIQVTTPDNRTCGTKLDTERLSFRDCDGLCIPSTEFWISENKILNWNGYASSYSLAIQEDPNCNGILDGPSIPQIHYFTVEGNSFNLADIIGELGRCILFQIKSDCQLTPWCPAQARRGIWSLPKDCLDNEDLCPPIRTEIDGNKYLWDDVAESYDIEIIGDDTCSNGSDGEMLSEWITTTENSLNLDEISARFGKCFKIRIYYSRDCPPTECLIQDGSNGYEKDGACTSGVTTRTVTKSNILKVFPNPASNKITVSSEHLEISSIALFNFYGKPIETFNTIKTLKKQIDLSRLSSGYYMLKVVFEDGSVQYKNVIIK